MTFDLQMCISQKIENKQQESQQRTIHILLLLRDVLQQVVNILKHVSST